MPELVQYITYKKEQYPIRVSYYVIKKVKEETKENIETININEDNLWLYEYILYYALIAGHHAEDKDMSLSWDEMPFVVDYCFEELNEKVKHFFHRSQGDQAAQQPNRKQRRSQAAQQKKS